LQTATVFAVALSTRASFADHYFVPSGSMEPTVHVGDHIIVNKAAYGLRLPLTARWLAMYKMPERGDVVVLEADQPEVLLKRVVAIGGDVVEVRSGRVRIGGKLLDEHADPTPLEDGDGGPDFGPALVPNGKVLVLGDNRGNSRDGRSFGFVDREHVLGRVIAIVARDGTPTYRPL
jgi:signal peptidase I